MNIDEAIEFCEIEAKRIERKGGSEWVQELQIKESANRFRQVSEWLRELKAYRNSPVLQRWLKQCDSCKHRHKLASEAPCRSCCHTFKNKHEGVKTCENSNMDNSNV